MRALNKAEITSVNGGIAPIIEAVGVGVGVYYGGSKLMEATDVYHQKGEALGLWMYEVTHTGNELGKMHYDASDFSSIPSFPNR